MLKYGRGLNREIVGAVNKGEIVEPITVRKVKKYFVSIGDGKYKLASDYKEENWI